MSLAIYTSAAWTNNGGLKVADNATIEVRRESDGALASIYSDRAGTQAITNPSAFGDASGRFQFFAAGGAYRVKVTQDGEEHTLRYQAIGTAGEFDASAVSQAVDSVEDLRTSTFPASLERLWLSGYYGVGTAGGGPLYRKGDGYTESDENGILWVDADGVGWEAGPGFVLAEDATLRVPSRFDTLQEALDETSHYQVTQGVTIDLLIESGHQPGSGLFVEHGDYGHFLVSSEDDFVEVSDSFSGDFIRASRSANAPVLNTLIEGKGLVGIGYGLFANCRGLVKSGCGVNDYSSHGLWIYQGSTCDAAGSVFENGNGPAARVSRSSHLNAEGSSFINCTDSEYVCYVNRASSACFSVVNCDGADAPAVFVCSRDGTIDAHRLPSQSCSNDFIYVRRASSIYTGGDSPITITVGGSAIVALSLSEVGVDSLATFVSSNGESDGIDCQQGAAVSFLESKLDGFDRGVVTQRGGKINCNGSEVLNSSSEAFVIQGDYLDGAGVLVDGAETGFVISRGASANLRSASINNVTGTKITGTEGSNIVATSVTVDGEDLEIGDTTFTDFNFADNGSRGFIWK